VSLSTPELKAKLDALQQKRSALFVEVENTQARQALPGAGEGYSERLDNLHRAIAKADEVIEQIGGEYRQRRLGELEDQISRGDGGRERCPPGVPTRPDVGIYVGRWRWDWRGCGLNERLRGRDSNPDYLIQSQASYH
jgi:hypothetical protein